MGELNIGNEELKKEKLNQGVRKERENRKDRRVQDVRRKQEREIERRRKVQERQYAFSICSCGERGLAGFVSQKRQKKEGYRGQASCIPVE
jgi:hypothetical protein